MKVNMINSAKQFINQKNKRLTLLGMSGVGKTHLAKLVGEEGGWYHFSGDYRIGATHLKEDIINNVANKMKNENKRITYIANHIRQSYKDQQNIKDPELINLCIDKGLRVLRKIDDLIF